MADEREEILRRVDIVELIGRRVALKKAGKHYKGLCPFHDDKNPSMQISPDTGRYRCWSCGAHGNAFDFVMGTQNLTFVEALKLLADEVGVKLKRGRESETQKEERNQSEQAMALAQEFFEAELQRSSLAREYLTGRGIDEETQRRWGLGYGPDIGDALAFKLKKAGIPLPLAQGLFLVDQDAGGGFYDRFRGRLMFPIHDERGRLVAFGGRLLGQGIPKYINSSDTPLYRKSRVLYGMHLAKDAMAKTRRAVLAEGYLDVIACHRAGVTAAVASLGTALAEDQVALLKRWCDEVVILYDSDAAGRKAADRACEMLMAAGIRARVALLPEGDDPDSLLKRDGEGAVMAAVERFVTPVDFRLQEIRRRLGPSDEAFWPEVVRVLAEVDSPLELERYLLPLAGEYPGIKDVVRARNALAKMVEAAQKKPGTESQGEPERRAPGGKNILRRKLAVTGPESAVLLALLTPSLTAQAWEACARPDLWASKVGSKTAAIVRESFPTAAPATDPAEWLGRLTDPKAAMVLSDLEMNQSEPLDSEALRVAVDELVRQAELRSVQAVAQTDLDDTQLLALHARLRKLKGTPEAANPEPDDPFAEK